MNNTQNPLKKTKRLLLLAALSSILLSACQNPGLGIGIGTGVGFGPFGIGVGIGHTIELPLTEEASTQQQAVSLDLWKWIYSTNVESLEPTSSSASHTSNTPSTELLNFYLNTNAITPHEQHPEWVRAQVLMYNTQNHTANIAYYTLDCAQQMYRLEAIQFCSSNCHQEINNSPLTTSTDDSTSKGNATEQGNFTPTMQTAGTALTASTGQAFSPISEQSYLKTALYPLVCKPSSQTP